MRFSAIIIGGLLLAACGDAQADSATDESGTSDTDNVERGSSTWLTFTDRDKCELAPGAAAVVREMAGLDRGAYGEAKIVPGSVTLPNSSKPVKAVNLADGEYGTPGVFLALKEDWNGLALRGLWVNAMARQVQSAKLPYDGIDIRLYFETQDDIEEKLRASGWTLSVVEDEDYGPEPVGSFSQQYWLDDNTLLDQPVDDFDGIIERTGQLPKVNGREVGNYAMNTIVQIVESSEKPGLSYLTCNVYAST